MRIHTVKQNEKISDIARKYGVDEDILRMNNGLENGECAEGEDVLVLTPTRTYTVRKGDTAERLALRFGIRRRDIIAMNPRIESEGLVPGRILALKYDQRSYGMAAANGYYYNGCSPEELNKKLSYLTYVTVGCQAAEDGRLRRLFDGRDAVGIARSADKIPLMRVYNLTPCDKISKEKYLFFTDSIINQATRGGYKGVTLAGFIPSAELLVDMRRRMIGCDLILITEINEKSPPYMSEYADGSIMTHSGSYDGCTDIDAYKKYATELESSRTFATLPSFAERGDKYLTVDEALKQARRGGYKLEYREDSGALEYNDKNGSLTSLPSLRKIKAILDTVHEYGYMGISFDIMRAPISYLMMYNSCYGTSTYTSVRSQEGCSRARGE